MTNEVLMHHPGWSNPERQTPSCFYRELTDTFFVVLDHNFFNLQGTKGKTILLWYLCVVMRLEAVPCGGNYMGLLLLIRLTIYWILGEPLVVLPMK